MFFQPIFINDHKTLLECLDVVASNDNLQKKQFIARIRDLYNEPMKASDDEVLERHRIRLKQQIN